MRILRVFPIIALVCVFAAPSFAQAPTPVVVTDKNGNTLVITGATSGTQVAAPTPVVLTDKNGNALNLGTGGASGTTSNQVAKGISSNSSGTSTAVDSVVCTPPATNGVYTVGYTVTASAAVAPTCPQVGLTPDQAAGATVLYSDNNNVIYNPAAALALPTPTTLGNANFFTTIVNNGSASTITPATWTISLNGGTAGATAVVPTKSKCSLVIDQVASTQWDLDCATIGASSATFPVTVSGTVTSGGIPCFNSTTNEQTSAALTVNVLVKGGGAGACPTNSAVTDNGTTVNTGSEPIVTTGSLSTGTSPPTCTVGTGGTLCGNEGTTSTGAASVDQFWADSTGHCWHANYNNTDFGCVAGLTPAQTFAALITFTTGTAAPLYEAGTSATSNIFQGGVDAAASSTLGSTTLRGADNSQANASAVAGSTTVRGGDATGATTNTTAGSLTLRGGNAASTGTPVPGAVTITGGGLTAAATNVAGADVTVAGGLGTGNAAVSHVRIKSPALGLASGTSAEAQITRFVTHVKAGSTSSATPTTMFNIASATNTAWGVEILVHVDLISSTPNVCGTTERISLTGTNNNGAFGTVNVTPGTISTLCSTGTLTLAATATAANPSVISITPTWGTITSITSATITIEIDNVSQQEITLL